MNNNTSLKQRLTQAIDEIKRTVRDSNQAELTDADLFTLWFLRCNIAPTHEKAFMALTNGSNDFSCDAIFISHESRIIHVVQTKYHSHFGKVNEKRAELSDFADRARLLTTSNSKSFDDAICDVRLNVKGLLTEARTLLLDRPYSLKLHFVTNGKVTTTAMKEAKHAIRELNNNEITFHVVDSNALPSVIQDFEDKITPAIPRASIRVENTANLKVTNILHRLDVTRKIECWVLPVNGKEIAKVYSDNGDMVFARNVRGYLGDKSTVSKAMLATLKSEPAMFVHYNNGITLVCDSAEKRENQGKVHLVVHRPQIINGQQTTRTLASSDHAKKASVLLKVIQLPRDICSQSGDDWYALINQIVKATNSQNPVTPSDLVSNDRIQIRLGDALRNEGFIYLRKRENHTEATRLYGPGKTKRFVKKLDLAAAVASCEFDQHVVRSGREHLFEEPWYDRVFPNTDPYFYLTRYFLTRAVAKASKERSEFGYARTMVVNSIWKDVENVLDEREQKKSFVTKMLNGDSQLMDRIAVLANATFIEAKKFYGRNCGKGEKQLDVSQFYRNKKGRNDEFAKERRLWSKTNRRKYDTARKQIADIVNSSDSRAATIIHGV